MMKSTETVSIKSCGNVFTDLGLENDEELQAKSDLAFSIREVIKQRNLTQKKAAAILGTHQTQVSRLNSGAGIDSMSFDLLISWLTKLNRNITLTVKKAPKSQLTCGSIQVAL